MTLQIHHSFYSNKSVRDVAAIVYMALKSRQASAEHHIRSSSGSSI